MNKKLILVLSVFALSTLFTACKNQSAGTNATTETKTETTEAASLKDLKIAYVNNDSLINSYDYYKQLSTAYTEKAKKAEQELQTRSRSLERKIQDAQTKISKGLVTRAEAEQLQQTLAGEDQNLQQYHQKVMAELGEEEQVMLNKIGDNVKKFMDKFNETAKYDIILNQNAAIIVGNPQLDITAELIEGLNKEFAAGIAPNK